MVIGMIIYFRYKAQSSRSENLPSEDLRKVDPQTLTIDGKMVTGLPLAQDAVTQLKDLKIANKVSSEWKPNLEKSLKAQGGDNVKEINIRKVDSFVWNHDGVALFVESVVVTLKNQKNEESSFKALVDAQNGKILKNWDQPIYDPLHPKDNFKVKIDPRYHNE
jgi:hypothetical protein